MREVLGAELVDCVPHTGEGDKFLLNADRNPNTAGAKLDRVWRPAMLPDCVIAGRSRAGKIRALIVLGENVAKHGIGEELLAKLELLVVIDTLPNKATELAHYVLPGRDVCGETRHVHQRERAHPAVERGDSVARYRPARMADAGGVAERTRRRRQLPDDRRRVRRHGAHAPAAGRIESVEDRRFGRGIEDWTQAAAKAPAEVKVLPSRSELKP